MTETGPDKDKNKHELVLKDYLSIMISALAFLTAALTPFFTFVRQTDNVSIVLSGFDPPSGKTSEVLRAPDTHLSAALINLGNRPAVVLSMKIAYFRYTPEYYNHTMAERCSDLDKQNAIFFDTDFRPKVLKEKDALTMAIRITGPSFPADMRLQRDANGAVTFELFPKRPSAKTSDTKLPDEMIDLLTDDAPTSVGACLAIAVATPSEAYHVTNLRLGYYQPADDKTLAEYPDDEAKQDSLRPRSIVRNEQTIFDEFFGRGSAGVK